MIRNLAFLPSNQRQLERSVSDRERESLNHLEGYESNLRSHVDDLAYQRLDVSLQRTHGTPIEFLLERNFLREFCIVVTNELTNPVAA